MNATLLVVDDDVALVQMLKSSLESEGYTVHIGFDGQMALQQARVRKPQLIIMDVNMPMTNGLQALEFLRKNPETAPIPVIFLTGASSHLVYPAVEAASRVAYLKKPLDIEQLNSLVKQFLQKYQTKE